MVASRVEKFFWIAGIAIFWATTSYGALQGYYPLNETNNPSLGTTIADASGLAHNGIMGSDLDPPPGVGAIEGIPSVNAALYGTAFNFNSPSTDKNYADFNPSPAFTYITRDSALTYAAWIKPSATQDFARPTFMGTNGSTYDFRIVPAGANWNLLLQSGTINSPPGFTSTLSLIPSDTWTHVAVVKSAYDSTAGSANVSFYVNGLLVESGTVPRAQSSSNTRRFFLGTGSQIDQYYSGGLDEVHVYNEALDANSIARLAIRQIGDFDLDGDVDSLDFSTWQTNFPTESSAALTQGDADGDGDVDGADFIAWQTNYPFAPGPGASPVPEPNAFLMALLACAAGVALGRRNLLGR